ncbi:MAG: hypothetical protein JSU07_09685 [Bacteroidetes bacterium]|nr:hypothetical protein [Bacteroidota bacterium]
MRFFSNDTLENQVCRPKSGINLYPFGQEMWGRTYKSNLTRIGFNSKENDRGFVSSGQGTQDYGNRIYNPSLGRFLSVDPEASSFAYNSPYSFAENRPVDGFDQDGLEYMNIHTFEMLKRSDPFKAFIVSALIKLKSPDMNTIEYKGMKYYNIGMHIFDKQGSKLTEWIYTKIPSVIGSTYNSWASSGQNCFKAAKKDVEDMGYKMTEKGAIRLYTSGGKKRASQTEKAVDMINNSLENGRPVVVGIDARSKKDYAENAGYDKSIDHYVVITGRDVIDGKQVFTFTENAMSDSYRDTSPTKNYFEITEQGDIIFGKGNYKDNSKKLDQFEIKVVIPTEKKDEK